MKYETILIRYYLDSNIELHDLEIQSNDVGGDGYSLKGVLQHVHNGHPAATLIYEREIPTRTHERPVFNNPIAEFKSGGTR